MYTLIQIHQLFSFCPVCFIIFFSLEYFSARKFEKKIDMKTLILKRKGKNVLSVSVSWYVFDFS